MSGMKLEHQNIKLNDRDTDLRHYGLQNKSKLKRILLCFMQ